MKELTIDGKAFQYTVIRDYLDRSDYHTFFFDGVVEVERCSFWGKRYKKSVPKFAFVVNEDIESVKLEKDDVRKLLRRHIEIYKGQIV